MEHTVSMILGTDDLLQRKKSALYILNLKEIHGLSELAVKSVIHETQSLFSHTVERLKLAISENLSRSGVDEPPSIKDVFGSVTDPFDGLSSTYLQERFYIEQF